LARKCRKRGRPKNTWRHTVEGEMKIMNNVEKMAKDRQKWRTFVAALHANGIWAVSKY
jgi:predicted ArsR family transcriptional regulator